MAELKIARGRLKIRKVRLSSCFCKCGLMETQFFRGLCVCIGLSVINGPLRYSEALLIERQTFVG